jgi:HEAT repeat protein
MAIDPATLDAPFAALAAFDWGGDIKPLAVIDAAVVAAHGDAPLTGELERRLAGVLGSESSRAAKQYACRKLSLIGTAASVPALADLLSDKDESHMARFALERIAAPEAAEALRKALGSVEGDLTIGMLSSLAARRDLASMPAIAALVTGDSPVAAAAAEALGIIATPEAAAALAAAKVSGAAAEAVVDARLACGEALVAAGKKAEAKAIYQAISAAVGDSPATHRGRAVRMACQRGLFAAMGG